MNERSKAAVVYIRVGNPDQLSGDRQREELLAKFGGTHQIVGEYRDNGPGSTGLKKLLEDAAKGKFDVLLCTDLARLTRRLSPEIITAIRDAGVQVVTVESGEIEVADLVAHPVVNQSAKTELQHRSERIKQGIRAARERRRDEADAAAGSGCE